MTLDTTINEVADLLVAATRNGLLEWESSSTGDIMTAKLGGSTFTLHATEATADEASKGLSWLFTLGVYDASGKTVYRATLDGSKSGDRESVDLLVNVWKMARETFRRQSSARLRPVVESLKSAIEGLPK
jgi:hypothetical protein